MALLIQRTFKSGHQIQAQPFQIGGLKTETNNGRSFLHTALHVQSILVFLLVPLKYKIYPVAHTHSYELNSSNAPSRGALSYFVGMHPGGHTFSCKLKIVIKVELFKNPI